MRVFVAGATGKTGRQIVKQLIQQDFSVIALVRDHKKAKAILPDSYVSG